MRPVVLFLAMSLDGYIADRRGGVDWLAGQSGAEEPDSYERFAATVDTVVMGWNTYRQIRTELSPEVWPYPQFTTYVVTHRQGSFADCPERVRITGEDPCALVERLREEPGGAIWICGGADVAQQLMEADLIDRYHLSLIPVLLGGGIPLFGRAAMPLRLLEQRSADGIAELIYERRR